MSDDRSLPLDHEPLNRAERRAAKFHQRAGRPDPHAVAAPAPGDEVAPGGDAASAGDEGSAAGAGSGGASETNERKPHHEGGHVGVTPKG
jgi:hypothetical protein